MFDGLRIRVLRWPLQDVDVVVLKPLSVQAVKDKHHGTSSNHAAQDGDGLCVPERKVNMYTKAKDLVKMLRTCDYPQ